MLDGLLGIIGTENPEPGSWDPADSNQDGVVDGKDIPFPPGSLEAKKAWLQIEAEAKSPESVAYAKSRGYEDAHGWYRDGPLRKGSHAGDSDYELLVDRLVFHDGHDPGAAVKIAGRVKYNLYGSQS
jgi:hypothetical protein